MTAAALAVVLATPVFAQQSEAPAAQPHTNVGAAAATSQQGGFLHNQDADQWRASKLIGASVYGPDNNSIGEINEVLIGANGTVGAVVIGVGGFLGVAEKDVALPFAALTIKRKPGLGTIDKITVSYSKEQLNNAPRFAFSDSPAQTTGERIGGQPINNRPLPTTNR
jgi:hypothetical protein